MHKGLPLIFENFQCQNLIIIDVHVKAYPQIRTFISAKSLFFFRGQIRYFFAQHLPDFFQTFVLFLQIPCSFGSNWKTLWNSLFFHCFQERVATLLETCVRNHYLWSILSRCDTIPRTQLRLRMGNMSILWGSSSTMWRYRYSGRLSGRAAEVASDVTWKK